MTGKQKKQNIRKKSYINMMMRWFIPLLLLVSLARADDARINCHPEPDANEQKCKARNCIWTSGDSVPGIPWCYMKPGVGYKQASKQDSKITLRKNNGPKNPWGQDYGEIYLKSSFIGKTLNVKIYAENRFEPPLPLLRTSTESSDQLELVTEDGKEFFSFVVKRKSTGTRLFDTSLGGLIFSDKFLQIVTKLPSDRMYGWGENVHPTLKHNFTRYTTWAMFARDEWPYSEALDTKNLYGVHPFYMVLEPDGKAHGVFILNSNAQEVTTAPGPTLIYRTIGGNLDLYFFPGPTPEEVTRQYLNLIGRPYLPAYWTLGFQISRYGYKDLNEMIEKIERNIRAGIPVDTVVADIDYMDRYKDFTIGKNFAGLPEYVKRLHGMGMRTVFMFDPAIQVDYASFEAGIKMGAKFIEWERYDQVNRTIQSRYPLVNKTKIMLGVVWPDGHVAFPDFYETNGKTAQWWISEFVTFWNKVGMVVTLFF
ncbi:glycosyl hydrolase, family 31 [Ancylostoma caninum]|uniref:Maltase n=1 Tax=Ancylostoma caninum TaxID=29170 RepID=A0A368GEP4_ANCCA|nr:glycosyl hydrolase, family 31 [Ancylostoma caninum]